MKSLLCIFVLAICALELSQGYSAFEDARIIAEYKRQQRNEQGGGQGPPTDHAKVARYLVHNSNWASVGTISTDSKLKGFAMVNVKSIDDNNLGGKSTGKIHFLLTDMDFTGKDWRHSNKVTFMFTDEQNLKCKQRGEDPMDPVCPRAMFSGKVVQMDKNQSGYDDALKAFVKRHPSAENWLKTDHHFYLCELDIENIYVLDYYGGAHSVSVEDFYNAQPDSNEV